MRRCRASRNDEIASDLRAYYRTTKKRNMVEAEKRLKHLDTKFKNWRVAAIDPPAITAYVQHRQEQKAANGTINRELAVLCRMLRLAYENNKLARVPVPSQVEGGRSSLRLLRG